MSELQRGTTVIPTIDAEGAAVSEAMGKRIREMVDGIKQLPLEVEMHPDAAAAWMNLGVVVSTIVTVPLSHPTDILRKTNRPALTFAGFPAKTSLDYPRDEIRVMFDSKGRNANGETMGPWTVAQIVNIGLPTYEAA